MEKLVDGKTLQERLEGLEQGFHNNRLEGLSMSRKAKERLRRWVREGLTEAEILARIRALYAPSGLAETRPAEQTQGRSPVEAPPGKSVP